MMVPKEIYRLLCVSEPTIPIFSKDWWLDSVCGDAWDVCLVENEGEVVASMPYVLKQRYGSTLLTMPPLTQTLGPWIRQSSAKYCNVLAREKELLFALIDHLPSFSFFQQNWHYSCKNWLPFYWRGFKQSTRYTYVIENLNNIDRVFADFSSAYRNKIRKTDTNIEVCRGLSIDEFYCVNKLTFDRQGLKIPYSIDLLRKQDLALSVKNAREIFYAKGSDGAIHSVLYLIWDDMSSYVHLVGENPHLRNSGAGIRLIWEAIKFTVKELGLDRFDFEGSMIEGVEQVRRDCGAKQVPYFSITKTPSRIMRARACLADLFRA